MLRSVVAEAGAPVEPRRLRLRIQPRLVETASPRLFHQHVKQAGADRATAILRQHRHPADLYAAVAAIVKAPRRDSLLVVTFPDQDVQCGRVGTVVFVDFQVERNPLLVHEDADSNRERFF